MDAKLQEHLVGIVGKANVSTAAKDLVYYGTDLSLRDVAAADAVVQPGSTDEVAAVVRIANETGTPVYPRGGGLSYTLGYTPTEDGGILLDTSRLNKIVEVDVNAMSITAQAGCTWRQLHEALSEKHLRLAFWGPLSGEGSTLGGCIANNVAWYGSAKYGTAGDTLLGLEVVTPNGEVIRTGSGAHVDGWRHFRYYGPDLTGLFVGDCGAFGIKTEATFELIPETSPHESMSFNFPSLEVVLQAASAVARSRLASEVFYLSSKRLDALVRAGHRFLEGATEVLHVSAEGPTPSVTRAYAEAVRAIITENGGTELNGELAGKWRDEPYMAFVGGITASMVSVNGEVWAPVHGILPFASGLDLVEKVDSLAAEYAQTFAEHKVYHYHLMCAVKSQLLVETNIVWPDELDPVRRAYVLDPRNVKMLGKVPTAMAAKALFKGMTRRRGRFDTARAVAAAFRSEVARIYQNHGCVSFQIGRFYDFAGHVSDEYLDRVRSVKQALDPNGIMNPGVLGI
jgi:FAD/FMN-containing dehydrogenase